MYEIRPDATQETNQHRALASQALDEQQNNPQQPLALDLIQSLPQGIAAISHDARLVCINDFLLDLAMLKGTTLDLPVPLDCDACPAQLRALLGPCTNQVVGPYDVDTSILGWECPSRTLHIEPHEIRNGTEHILITVTDITLMRMAEDARAEFIAQVAHELRTPLQHIMGFAGIMCDMDGLEPEDYQRFSSQVHTETRVMARLITDLTELARITNGQFTIEHDLVDLTQLVSDVAERTRQGAISKGLSLHYNIPKDDVVVSGDSVRLTQVLVNLVENGIKYVPSGGNIQLSVKVNDGKAIVSVADDGQGIPADAVEHVFDQFFQVQKGAQRAHRGMGLGLYISREIIHAHNGEIWVESKQGHGSRFSFSLALNPQTGGKS